MLNFFLKKIKRKLKKNDLEKIPIRPVSNKFGYDRGKPIDREYIDIFLKKNSQYITGNVMEIAETTYTDKYGENVLNKYIFTNDIRSKDGIIGDLQTGEGVKEEFVDCFILTQTLPFIFDIKSATKNIIRMLKSNGYALITVRGISMISRYDEKRWGDYWGFTRQSLENLFAEIEECTIVTCEQYGNVKTAIAFLLGIAQEELEMEDFSYNDDLYPVLLGIVVKKNDCNDKN